MFWDLFPFSSSSETSGSRAFFATYPSSILEARQDQALLLGQGDDAIGLLRRPGERFLNDGCFPVQTTDQRAVGVSLTLGAMNHRHGHTVFPREQGLLSIRRVRVGLAADDDDVDVLITKKLVGRAVVFGIGIVDRAVRAGLGRLGILGRFCSLEEGGHAIVRVSVDEGQVETLDGESVADETDSDGRHGDSVSFRIEYLLAGGPRDQRSIFEVISISKGDTFFPLPFLL